MHKKIFKTYLDETNKTFYVEVSTHARFCVEGAKTVEMLELDDVDIAQFTEIPESAFASISDTSTGDTTSTWSSSKINSKLGGLSFSASGTTLSITNGTNTWTLEANS